MPSSELQLIPFPLAGAAPALKVGLQLRQTGNGVSAELAFRFRFSGDAVSRIIWPPLEAPTAQRRDGLWKTTVVELFLASGPKSYFELNLAPHGDWNLYAFTGYREGMSVVGGLASTPHERFSQDNGLIEIGGRLSLAALQLAGPVVLGAAAVLEYTDGHKEYWALAHKGEKPDFHLSSSFIASV